MQFAKKGLPSQLKMLTAFELRLQPSQAKHAPLFAALNGQHNREVYFRAQAPQ